LVRATDDLILIPVIFDFLDDISMRVIGRLEPRPIGPVIDRLGTLGVPIFIAKWTSIGVHEVLLDHFASFIPGLCVDNDTEVIRESGFSIAPSSR
jgi:hypothetical protein